MFEPVLNSHVARATGGNSGIGGPPAVPLVGSGVDVALTYPDDEDGAEESTDATRRCGRHAVALRGDARQEVAVETCFDRATNRLGTPVVLIDSAGINLIGGGVEELTLARWEDVIRTAMTATMLASRRFVRDLKSPKRRGRIINLILTCADVMRAVGAEYIGRKGGQKSVTQMFAFEAAADGITVNAIASGTSLTRMSQAARGIIG